MDQCEDREEGVPPSKSSSCGEDESQSKGQRIHQRCQPEPEPSCVSYKSNDSMDHPLIDFKSADPPPSERVDQRSSEVPSGPSVQQHQTQSDSIFMLSEDNIVTFVKNESKKIQKVSSSDDPGSSESQRNDEEGMEGEDEEQKRNIREALMKTTVNFSRKVQQMESAERSHSKIPSAVYQRNLKFGSKKKFQCVFEGIAKEGSSTLSNQIYTELYITEGGTGEVNDEHEVRQIETASRNKHTPETAIRQEDIFKVPPGRDQPIRTLMTKGVAGIGKTVLTQKFTSDWAEGKAHQNIQFIFPFTFRESNLSKEKKFTLVELIHHFFTETREICSFENFQVSFIFDGSDENRLPSDFHNKEISADVTQSSSVDVLSTNLIRGHMLPSALLWITTRPAAANQIPPYCVGMVTEIRGFTDPQKEEYFRKRFRDKEQTSRIISHIKTSRSLHIMCHIPVFCWITATVSEDVLETKEVGESPKTSTEMYIHFSVVQTKVKKIKYNEETEEMFESSGKLAFDQSQKGNSIFYESDSIECGINIRAASVYSGVFTQIFKEERGGSHEDKVFCFVHSSVQEFSAALHVHSTFINSGVISMEETQTSKDSKPKSLHQRAVDQALQSPNGHSDLFLRFLSGLSMETNQKLLQRSFKQTGSSSEDSRGTVEYIKEKISENVSAEKSINLFHCSNESNDHSIVEEIQQSSSFGRLSSKKLSPAQWSASGFIIVSSEEDSDVFDSKKYCPSEEAFSRSSPFFKAPIKALLSGCDLSEKSCEASSSVLSSQSSSLRESDSSTNNSQDSGVKLLSAGSKSPNCKSESLRLSYCNLQERSYKASSSVLSSQFSSLSESDSSNNNFQDSGMKLSSAGSESPNCKSETLRSSGCNFSKRSCEASSSVLSSQYSSLRESDSNISILKDSGMKLLSAGSESPNCKSETLSLSGCSISEEGCVSSASASSSNPLYSKKLDSSYNHPGDSGLESSSAGSKDPHWKSEDLRVEPAGARWLTPGSRKYSCQLTIDTNTVSRESKSSEDNRKVTWEEELQSYPDHPDRFDGLNYQLSCRTGSTGRCYWEVEWRGVVYISVSYRRIRRKGSSDDCWFGSNDHSWSSECSYYGGYSVYHNNIETRLSSSFVSQTDSHRISVYLDVPAGISSFYRVSSDSSIHLHTFNTTFTEPLIPGFMFWSLGSSVFSV